MTTQTACVKCGAVATPQMRFCSNCGRSLASKAKGFVPAAIGLSVLLLAGGIGLQLAVRGSKIVHPPIRGNAKESSQEQPNELENPQLAAMRKSVEEAPEDITKLKMYAGMLGDVLRANPGTRPEVVFETIDVLGKILQREPNDPTALVMMADVSFDQRAFTKALDFYERYLKVEVGDLGARARYASTLTFLGRYDDSIRELRGVLQSDPKNFPAMAYLAITYAQKGEIPQAKKVGTDALALAPSEDARARFSSFVSSLDEAGAQEKPQNVAQGDAAVSKKGGDAEQNSEPGVEALIATLKANPVAGPKFVRLETPSPKTVKIFYRDFPMSQMPPFAKEKFVGGVKAAIERNGLVGVEEVVFADASSGAVMESVAIASR